MHFYLTDHQHKNLDIKVSANELGYVLYQVNDCVCLTNGQLERLIKEYQYDQRRQSLKDRG